MLDPFLKNIPVQNYKIEKEREMNKRSALLCIAASALFLLSADAGAAPSNTFPTGTAANGIAATRHNLGSLGMFTITSSTTEICVFCHTPHHASSTATDLRPLWNRRTPPGPFTAYGTTIGGTVIGVPGSTTLACLGCHDGVTTLDNIVNIPGKGGVDINGLNRNWRFYNITQTGPTDLGISPTIGFDSRLNIGIDLSNDHPISVPYKGGEDPATAVASLRDVNTTISQIDLSGGMAVSAVNFDAGNLTRNFWDVKGFISDTARISDLLRNGRVECSSCHDPHFGNTTGASIDQGFGPENETTSGLFLRRVGGNVGSAVCRTCHNK